MCNSLFIPHQHFKNSHFTNIRFLYITLHSIFVHFVDNLSIHTPPTAYSPTIHKVIHN